MDDLSEIAQRILAELEEGWSQNIYRLINTIFVPDGHFDQVDQFRAATGELLARNLVAIRTEAFHPRNPQVLTRPEAIAALDALRDWFQFDTAEGLWNLSRGTFRDARIPVIYLTNEGLKAATAILDQRGYQWWRQSAHPVD